MLMNLIFLVQRAMFIIRNLGPIHTTVLVTLKSKDSLTPVTIQANSHTLVKGRFRSDHGGLCHSHSISKMSPILVDE